MRKKAIGVNQKIIMTRLSKNPGIDTPTLVYGIGYNNSSHRRLELRGLIEKKDGGWHLTKEGKIRSCEWCHECGQSSFNDHKGWRTCIYCSHKQRKYI